MKEKAMLKHLRPTSLLLLMSTEDFGDLLITEFEDI